MKCKSPAEIVNTVPLEKIATWVTEHEENLKSIFVEDYCKDTGTENTEENFLEFSIFMYGQCKH